jgi:serine/threonine protein kinase
MGDQKLPFELAERYDILYGFNNGSSNHVYAGYDYATRQKVVIACFNEKYFHVTRKAIYDLFNLRHLHLVKIRDIYVSSPSIIIIQDYIYGQLLSDLMSSDQMPKRKNVEKWIQEIHSALIYLHNHEPYSFGHGDLKPENVIIDCFGMATIIDFSSFVELNNQAGFRDVKATRRYAADETLRYGIYNAHCDLYSFELLCQAMHEKIKPGD